MSADRVCSVTLLELFKALVPGGSTVLALNDDWRAMILCEDSTVPDEIDDPLIEFLDEYTDLDEYADASYARITLGSILNPITVSLVGTKVKLDFPDDGWAALAGGSVNSPKWIGIYIVPAGTGDAEATNRMLLLLEATFTPDGSQVALVVPTAGIALFNCVPI